MKLALPGNRGQRWTRSTCQFTPEMVLTCDPTCVPTPMMQATLHLPPTRLLRPGASRDSAAPYRRLPAPLVLVFACLALAGHSACVAQIYSGVAGTGIVLSNFPSDSAPALLIPAQTDPAAAGGVATPARELHPQPTRLRPPVAPAALGEMISEVAKQVKIAPELLHAVIAVESNYNSSAVSPRGAIGLMQLMPATATRFGATNPYVARQNVLAGASYLKWLMVLFNNDLELVLAAYNAGEQAVLKAGGRIPPYLETQAYVPRVLAYLRCARNVGCMPA